MDKSSDKGTKHRTHEDRGSEDDNSDASLSVVKHVGEHCCDHGQRARAEEAGEKATKHDGLDVLASCAAKGENREAEHTDADW